MPLAHLALHLLVHKLIDIIIIDLLTEPALIFKVFNTVTICLVSQWPGTR
jgi:hypothetical protein